MNYKTALKDAIDDKLRLLEKIQIQMKKDVEDKVLSAVTLEHIHTATESLKAALLRIDQDKADDAMYLFSRGCWNLGEFMGRVKFERPPV